MEPINDCWNPLDFLVELQEQPEQVNLEEGNPALHSQELEVVQILLGADPKERDAGEQSPHQSFKKTYMSGGSYSNTMSPTPVPLRTREGHKERTNGGGLGTLFNPCGHPCVHMGCLIELRPGPAGNGSSDSGRLELSLTAGTITPLRVVAELHTSRSTPCGGIG